MKKPLAVFDIDGTLFRSSLLIELTNGLVQEGIFPKDANTELLSEYIQWVNREGEYSVYLKKVIENFEHYIVGCPESDVEFVTEKVLEKEKKKLYRYTRNLILELKSKNYFLFAISGSPGHILTSFAKEVGFDKYLGGYYEVANEVFTGFQPFGNPSHDKRKTLQDFLDKGNGEFDLSESVGIGDTESDISFLEMVENPIAFNPNYNLTKYAKNRGWKIIVERKDVIFELDKFSFKGGIDKC